jgi:hypothetical protein
MTVRKTRSKKGASVKKKAERPSPRKREKPRRTVAETRGLVQRDGKITAETEDVNGSGSSLPENIIDQQFRVWSAMMRMSPLPFILQQQAVAAKLILGFMLPARQPPAPGEKK